jgi:tellurite resistance protein
MQDDEFIMRVADGELDAAERDRAAARLAADPAFSAAVERQRALRRTLAAAFDPCLREPVPERLIETVRAGAGDVVPLAPRRTAAASRGFGAAHWGAMAATLLVGVFAGQLIPRDSDAMIDHAGDRLVARGELAEALTARLASDTQAAQVRIGLSFRARDGAYCRTFEGAKNMTGVACREAKGWAVRMAVRRDVSAEGTYRMAASGLSPAVLAVVEGMIDGEPLDAGQEASARARGWMSAPK